MVAPSIPQCNRADRRKNEPDPRRVVEDRHVKRRQLLACGVLLAFLASPAAFPQSEPDCSQPDLPTGSIQVTGPQIRIADRLIAGPAARIEVTATDAAGGAAQWTPMVDGRESAWPDSWNPGEHTVGAIAIDACGRRAPLAPVTFVVDAEPPAIRWEAGDRKFFTDSRRLAPDTERERRRIRYARKDGRPAEDSWLSEAGVWQMPLPWVRHPEKTFLSRARFPVQIASNHPQAFLAAPETIVSLDGADTGLGERLLWLEAEDAGAGVERLTLRLRNEQDRAVLEVEAVDTVGNTSRKEIVLRRGR
jgi:hypothetical protein